MGRNRMGKVRKTGAAMKIRDGHAPAFKSKP